MKGAVEYDRRYDTRVLFFIFESTTSKPAAHTPIPHVIYSKEKAGYIAGKHILKPSKWWFQSSKKGWYSDDNDESE